MSVSVFANDYSIMDLEECGQVHWIIEGKADVAPTADGVIDDGEYTLEITGMIPSEDDADNRFFCIDPQALDVEEFNLYLSYDDEYLYVGAEVKESEALAGEVIYFYFSCNPTDLYDGPRISYVFGGAPDTSEAEAFNAAVDGDVVTYEIVIRRTMLIDYMGYDDVDDIKDFAMLIIMGDDRDTANYPDLWPEMWFGCVIEGDYEGLASGSEAAESEGKLWGGGGDGRRFPHVMTLGEAVVIETEPTETEPTETEPTQTEPTQTEPTQTEPTETTPTETPAEEGGCGSSIAAVAVALVATLGTCVAFINKRR